MDNILEMRGITKIFPGVVALDHVDFDLRPGEVHVLLGENGAGKSTLIKILAGAYTPTEGTIQLEGRPVAIERPKDALRLGVRIIYQELMVNEYITVTENIFQGRELKKHGLIDWKEMHRQAGAFLSDLDYDLDPRALVQTLGIAKKQIVEIVKAVSSQCKIIVFDEPTASLSPKEIETLFGIIRNLKSKGIGIVYISHRMPELYEIGDRVTVLRDGKKIETHSISDVTPEQLVTMVSGHKVEERVKQSFSTDEIVLDVQRMPTVLNKQEGISFSLHRGEILGVTGLVGAGKTELARSLCGIDNLGPRQITLHGKPLPVKNYTETVKNGIAYLSEDRRGEGLVLIRSIADNISLPTMDKVRSGCLIDQQKESRIAREYIEKLRIRTPGENALAMNLSGGNQQKVVIAKWLLRDAEILIFDEPTRGIDVGAKEEIYRIMFDLAASGKAIIMISSDIDEILRAADRVIVLKDGKKCAELTDVRKLTKDTILNYSFGVN
ncbi:sugar ABC transporter ATP-binding protein [Agathobaculum sp. NTUH-O15-33]|uniref:sugar ABC transporter ATP-binding protein n=1 Tax=Agathobaculum sp. NTUH-O15-33 TaxID=3079302 RepID=UPI002958431A|nr:sugar ABC transporter ATP-binding protein [Agathobaculum sp. NTUH-O15-33]WNX85658.1 sugar ABC transporter ATP-binding protein [Agathobaculum sp. NTUH-O15-33]